MSWSGEIHPAAGIFPLSVGVEFDALVDDIRQNGLREPGKIDGEGRLLDGRNRARACDVAGAPFDVVEVDLNGDDPIAYVVSLNVKRRGLSASQRAIGAAEACQISDTSARRAAVLFGINRTYVAQAVALVEGDPVGAESVKAGTRSLVDAYDELRKRERAAESHAQKAERVRVARPDLAERVDAGSLSLDEALALLEADEQRERERARVASDLVARSIRALVDEPENAELLLARLARHGSPLPVPASDCRAAAAFLNGLADRLEAGG